MDQKQMKNNNKNNKQQNKLTSIFLASFLVAFTIGASLISYHGFGYGISKESDYAATYNAGVTLQTQITGQLADAVKKLETQVTANTKAIGLQKGGAGNTDTVIREIRELERAVTALERRVTAGERNDAHLKSVSEVRISGPAAPSRNRLLPNKVIEYRGRTSYSLTFDLITRAVRPYWTNMFHVGDTNGIRSPGIWLYPSNRRAIHFRQSGEVNARVNWNWGCDPSDSVTPGLNRWYKVSVQANKHAYTVYYNGQVRCRVVFDVHPPAGQQHTWFSDPWYHASPVLIRNLFFRIY